MLFFIFYMATGDVLQIMAGNILYGRLADLDCFGLVKIFDTI
jgi:hypothetical protein